ncbi:MAG TPA: CDP-diacylglycerol--glycerol-3-phosphate 3-phosphatidyltransferase [Syntrophorhabdaceae bacterium]|jgi:CDP-diacylglycerol--glycerol-3-phosphate 3-phosphatidyltransferase|nr:CDP-diacylglycerol--glycerol-3-phosphate 3-phosphatidyltransferase [Syntrophorhabdaceae bacterium]MDI9561341.1 CDP-diacylglycerol--glycerol-3-phosphate 3-phosphatidyltransferase [Pseudomonadota bacterium]OQC48226.1 MAG: CDP-diacylglycerol--glycerol-3-phosphate 3-phosphatidyltransferase [Deltaproteobacteria bacterium ADurb.Bin026]MBP8697551.1 CDP-diacylglycerol--glycerol-3-phosphate 3-phosphatidyltransferase [Syntrophorhabdaceae bacterium]MBV6505911.1 CDP-diacylglycerol--glycerol-3-phosphate 
MKVKDEKASVWTLPNRLSIIRILFIPIIIILISTEYEELLFASCLLFIIAGITDGLDGYIARKMRMTTKLGLYLDPIADKLLVSSVLITLSYYRMIPLWVTILLVAREFLINGLRSFYAMEGITIYPSFAGKFKTTLQIIGIACMLFNSPLKKLDTLIHQTGLIVLYIALFFSIYSAIHYMSAIFKSVDVEKQR